MENVVVTGGAGFIGSHLVETLMQDAHGVRVVDNLLTGRLDAIIRWQGRPGFEFTQADINDASELGYLKNCSTLFHLAADPDVRAGSAIPSRHFDQNIRSTYNILEATRKSDVERLIFTSTSTVYGEPSRIPTSENYGPLMPISIYGASKLACESLISAYSATYGFNAVIFRLANVIGARCNHGVVYDLVKKLKTSSRGLEILGDGHQEKSYLDVSDCVKGMLHGMKHSTRPVEIFNLGSEDRISVLRIAEVVCEEMNLPNVEYRFTPGTPDGRGWPGDVKIMQLDITKLYSTGWKPTTNSEGAVRATAKNLAIESMKPSTIQPTRKVPP